MSERSLQVLGTASQVPTAHRNHNGFVVRWDGQAILFDPGEGTQRQMTVAGVRASELTAICLSHFHGDHCLGLPGVLQRLALDEVPQTVDIVYPASGQPYVERLTQASIHAGLSPLRFVPLPAEGGQHRLGELTLTARPLDHAVDCLGYRLSEPDSRRFDKEALARAGLAGPRVGQLQREGHLEHEGRTWTLEEVSTPLRGQAFAFVMDTRACPAASELLHDADLAVVESTFLDDQAELAHRAGHLTARRAAELAHHAGVRRLVLAHFSQRYRTLDGFAEQAAAHADVVLARDPTPAQPQHASAHVRFPPRR